MPKIVRTALVWAAILYAVSLPASFVIGGALFARPVKDPVSINDLSDALDPEWDRTFLGGLKEVSIQLRPGVLLKATILGGDSHATVVVLHESRKNRISALPAAYALWGGGFDILLLDRRAHGSSDGDMLPLFGGEQVDLSMVIDQLLASDWSGTSKIGLFGIGDAGTSCLIAAAADPRIDAVVAEGPALRADDFVAAKLHSWLLLPEPLLFAQTYLAVKGLCVVGDVEPRELDASPMIRNLSTPTQLLLNSSSDSRRAVQAVFDALPAGNVDLQECVSQEALYAEMVDFFARHL